MKKSNVLIDISFLFASEAPVNAWVEFCEIMSRLLELVEVVHGVHRSMIVLRIGCLSLRAVD